MIAKVSNISSFAAAIRYVVEKKEELDFFGEIVEKDAAVRIGGWINTNSVEGIIKEFEMVPNRLKHPGKHISLALPIGESVDDDTWLNIAHDVMEARGYGNSQWVCYRHTDTDHEHVHIIANRKDFNGKTVKDGNEKYKFMETMRDMEEKYNLKRFIEDKNRVKESTLEVRLGKKGIITDKKELHSKIKVAVSKSSNWLDFPSRLQEQGVKWTPRLNEEGKETGARYEYKDRTYSGSKVGYSLQTIESIFFEKQQAKEHRLEDLKQRKSLSAKDFAELIISDGNTTRLSLWLEKRDFTSKDHALVMKLYKAMEQFSYSDEEFRKEASKAFQDYHSQYQQVQQKLVEEHAKEIRTIERENAKEEIIDFLMNNPAKLMKGDVFRKKYREANEKGVGAFMIKMALGVDESGKRIPFIKQLHMNGYNNIIQNMLNPEDYEKHIKPVVDKGREYYKTFKYWEDRPKTNEKPEVVLRYLEGLAKSDMWQPRYISDIIESYTPEVVKQIDLSSFDERKRFEIQREINNHLGLDRGDDRNKGGLGASNDMKPN